MKFPHKLVLFEPGSYARDLAGKVESDDAGYPVMVDVDELLTFFGWLQPSPTPKRIKDIASPEILAADDSGEAFGSHLLFAPFFTQVANGSTVPLVFVKRGRIRREPADGLEYVIATDGQDAGGRGHHQEIDLVEYRYGTAAP